MAAVVEVVSRVVSRPLKVLVPLIKEELAAADAAGLEHYRRVGGMLLEARDQCTVSWTSWLSKNFEMSRVTAWRYMRLAEHRADPLVRETKKLSNVSGPLSSFTGERVSGAKWKPLFEAASRVDAGRLAEDRQSRDDEVMLRRELAASLIDLGYRALAAKLHPDHRGGSSEAMARLNAVRDELKSVAAVRRFI